MTNARERILSRIEQALGGKVREPMEPPGIPEIWPPDPSPPEALFARFERELAAVHGEAVRASSPDHARARLRSLADQFRWHRIGYRAEELVNKVVDGLGIGQLRRVDENWTPEQVAELDAAVVPGELFLADTGSALVLCRHRWERLLYYLPPSCVIVGHLDRLYAHLAAAWSAVAAWSQDRSTRGEFVIITGPSRTSDIEKVLTLGVHGPKQLWVFLID
ncbi:MAG: LUD domain-containing protein [Thermoguttaceae bacterium]|nr:LUD domain-containing protein [Thermoguttaceae bacterium]MDW8077648.1 LUD domain-containing protein [Thermoguttaceae bacterium]